MRFSVSQREWYSEILRPLWVLRFCFHTFTPFSSSSVDCQLSTLSKFKPEQNRATHHALKSSHPSPNGTSTTPARNQARGRAAATTTRSSSHPQLTCCNNGRTPPNLHLIARRRHHQLQQQQHKQLVLDRTVNLTSWWPT